MRRIRGRFLRRASLALGVTLILFGATTLVGLAIAPQAVEGAYGAAKIGVEQITRSASSKLQEAATGEKSYEQVMLGVSGSIRELNRCDGTFTEMKSYERDGVPPVWAAHNNCGGDIILPWEIGTELQLAGDSTVYEVVDIRYTSKIWSSTDDLVGLQGSFALQSCFYGEDRMKFVGLRPVA